MIQEKDFLYRVPVKNALVTAPGQQVRNPEILVDIEGGEFMCGNILDANSTNKLINQSVKDAVDNKLIESGYVTKDLLEKEVNRATGVENDLKAAVATKANATALSNYVLTTSLNQQVNILNTAIDTKQPKGNYLTQHQSLEEYAKKTELPTVPTKVSELQNDSQFIVKSVYDEKIAALEARIAALEAKHTESAA